MKMSLHRALSELKMLDKRIYAAINSKKYIGYQIGSENPVGFKSKEELEDVIKSGYQSVTDLINRRNLIKSKLVLANATTKIEVAGVEMTIAEAIDQKEYIAYKESLLNELKREYAVNNQVIERELRDVEIRLDKRLESDLGKDHKNKAQEVEQITESFMKRYKPNTIDPLNLQKEIDKLEKEITDFEVEVDATLSEINAVTFIELED